MELSIIPNAVGPGMSTTAGSGPNRNGSKVIHVTNLADAGRGSLREAVETKGPRIVVFDVSGYIELQSVIKLYAPYLTIAGQTAPFPGITLKGAGLRIRTHDVLVQHIRLRIGDQLSGPDPRQRDALQLWGSAEGTYNIIVDHVSMSWAVDENMETWFDTVYDVSITNCIISEALENSIHPKGPHSKGVVIGEGTKKFLMLGNLLVHNDQRNIAMAGNTSTLFVNNVVYNWRGAGGMGNAGEYQGVGGDIDASIVGNVYIRGLDTRSGDRSIPIFIRSNVSPESRFYIEDNEAVERSSDPWSVVRNEASDSIRVEIAPNWPAGLIVRESKVVKNWVLDHVGARRADDDLVDLRILRNVKNGTGRIIDSQNDVGGWPPLENNTRVLIAPSNAIQPSGYTNVEEWLHKLSKQVEGIIIPDIFPEVEPIPEITPVVEPLPEVESASMPVRDGLLLLKKYFRKYIAKVEKELKILKEVLDILEGK